MLGIINDLLDFSKIEAGKLELEPANFSLRAALGDTLRTLAIRAHNKGLELVSHVQPDVPDALVGDVGRLRQVLLNLVGNAIKFTEEGEVIVEVGFTDDTEARIDDCLLVLIRAMVMRVAFTVRDTGIGIAPEKQEKIFRAFEQEDTSTTRKYGGTGLGLTIASRLVTLMGGTIHVDSEPGRGSTFAFTAQFGRQPQPAERIAAAAAGPALQPAGAHRRRQRHQPPDSGGVAAWLADGTGGGGRRRVGDGYPLGRGHTGASLPARAARRPHAGHGRAGAGSQDPQAARAVRHSHHPVDFGGPARQPGPPRSESADTLICSSPYSRTSYSKRSIR